MDLIDKQEVRLIESDADAYPQEWNDDYEKGFCDAIHKVLELPTVDAQPLKHGRWIPFMPDCRGYTEEFECSLCKNMTYLHCCEKYCDYEYCPNCGEKMDGDADD